MTPDRLGIPVLVPVMSMTQHMPWRTLIDTIDAIPPGRRTRWGRRRCAGRRGIRRSALGVLDPGARLARARALTGRGTVGTFASPVKVWQMRVRQTPHGAPQRRSRAGGSLCHRKSPGMGCCPSIFSC